jgi:alpha-ketoglutarate-dependent taurine dioxygenase
VANHGALLIRGLMLEGPEDVLAVAHVVANGLTDDTEAFAPRTRHLGQIYSSTAWPAAQQMCMHHELSYRQTVPGLMLFGCLKEPSHGGAIPLADSTKVLEVLPSDLVKRFEKQGWILRRAYSEDIGLSVVEAFGTGDRDEIDLYCSTNGIETEWTNDGVLRTRQKRRAVVEHPERGHRSWFNQIAFLNEWTMKPQVREFLLEMYGEGGLPFTTLFGDGEPVGPDIVATINDAYDACTVREPLYTNDLLIVDNLATAHSREPFEGDREVVVALGEPKVLEADLTIAARPARRKRAARSG